MTSKNYYWNLSIVFLTVLAVYSNAESQPESNTNEVQVLENHFRSKSYNDSHIYYNSTTIINDDNVFDRYWVDLANHKQADRLGDLSFSYQKADTFNLHFQFPFYGRLVNKIIVSNGGFLFFGEMNVYSWTAQSQYIAPLMADFDNNVKSDSHIYIKKNDTTFIVSWLNVSLQHKHKVRRFSFQTILYSNGNIVFAYKNLPMKIKEMNQLTNHPVKIGLSDAYVEDKLMSEDVKNVTITEYNRIMVNQDEISNKTVIIFTPLTKCIERKNCASCIEKDINLQCYWCDNRCSSVIDYQKGCENITLNSKDICVSEISTLPSTTAVNSSVKTTVKSGSYHNPPSPHSKLLFFTISGSIALMILTWTLYAYLFPYSRPGRFLMRLGPNLTGCRASNEINRVDTMYMK